MVAEEFFTPGQPAPPFLRCDQPIRHGGPDRAGLDGENRDAMLSDFRRERFCETYHRGFARVVGRHIGNRKSPGVAGNIDDATLPSGHHARQDSMAAQESATDIDLQTGPPILGVNLPRWSDRTAYTSVVDEQINPAKPSLDSPDGFGHVPRAGYVCSKCRCPSTSGLNVPDSFRKLLVSSRYHGDRHSCGRQSQRKRAAETPPSAGNHCRLTDQAFTFQGRLSLLSTLQCEVRTPVFAPQISGQTM